MDGLALATASRFREHSPSPDETHLSARLSTEMVAAAIDTDAGACTVDDNPGPTRMATRFKGTVKTKDKANIPRRKWAGEMSRSAATERR